MATFKKRAIGLTIRWDKNDGSNITYSATCKCVVVDDSKDGGEEQFTIPTPSKTLTRTQFRGLSGQQIENQILSDIDDALQLLGSGAGTHTLENDFGS